MAMLYITLNSNYFYNNIDEANNTPENEITEKILIALREGEVNKEKLKNLNSLIMHLCSTNNSSINISLPAHALVLLAYATNYAFAFQFTDDYMPLWLSLILNYTFIITLHYGIANETVKIHFLAEKYTDLELIPDSFSKVKCIVSSLGESGLTIVIGFSEIMCAVNDSPDLVSLIVCIFTLLAARTIISLHLSIDNSHSDTYDDVTKHVNKLEVFMKKFKESEKELMNNFKDSREEFSLNKCLVQSCFGDSYMTESPSPNNILSLPP